MPVIRPHIVAMLSKKSMKNGVQQDKNARKESKLVGPTMRQFIKMIVMIMIMKGESRKAIRPCKFLSNELLAVAKVYNAHAMAGTMYSLSSLALAKSPNPPVATS